jgi:hypothetical protein
VENPPPPPPAPTLANPLASGSVGVGPLEGVVTYTYTPRTLAAIPETPPWAAMLVGFASLGFAGHRAKRKGRGSNGVSKAH